MGIEGINQNASESNEGVEGSIDKLKQTLSILEENVLSRFPGKTIDEVPAEDIKAEIAGNVGLQDNIAFVSDQIQEVRQEISERRSGEVLDGSDPTEVDLDTEMGNILVRFSVLQGETVE